MSVITKADYNERHFGVIKDISIPDTTIQFGDGTALVDDKVIKTTTSAVFNPEIYILNHFIRKVYSGDTPIRLLEVGATPLDRTTYPAYPKEALFTSLSGLLSELPGTICCANDYYISERPVDWKKAAFVQGDFTDKKTQDSIEEKLGGRPDIIFGVWVFINNLGDYMLTNKKESFGDPSSLGDRVSMAAWDFLNPRSNLLVFNKEYHMDFLIPEFLQGKQMSHFYWDQYARVYQK